MQRQPLVHSFLLGEVAPALEVLLHLRPPLWAWLTEELGEILGTGLRSMSLVGERSTLERESLQVQMEQEVKRDLHIHQSGHPGPPQALKRP